MDSKKQISNSLAFELNIRLAQRQYHVRLKSTGTWLFAVGFMFAQLMPELIKFFQRGG